MHSDQGYHDTPKSPLPRVLYFGPVFGMDIVTVRYVSVYFPFPKLNRNIYTYFIFPLCFYPFISDKTLKISIQKSKKVHKFQQGSNKEVCSQLEFARCRLKHILDIFIKRVSIGRQEPITLRFGSQYFYMSHCQQRWQTEMQRLLL